MKLTVREAARVLNVSETKIYRWVDEDAIPFVMIQHHPMFHRFELLEWALETEIPLETDLYEHEHDQPLTAALLRGGGRALGGSLEDIIADMPVPDSERALLRSVIAARQSEMFRGRAADRIALPRAGSPIICFETPPLAMLWWCDRALVIDGVTVTALIVIVTPTIHQHLKLLSRLSRALQDRPIAAAFRQAAAFDQVIAEVGRFERELSEPGSRS